MSNKISLDDFSPHLFWDLDDFDFEKHQKFFAQRVIEYGKMNDWILLKNITV